MKMIVKNKSYRKTHLDLNVGIYTNIINIKKCNKYKKCLGKMMLILIKQPLSTIYGSFH